MRSACVARRAAHTGHSRARASALASLRVSLITKAESSSIERAGMDFSGRFAALEMLFFDRSVVIITCKFAGALEQIFDRKA